jgi:hypothetical protein
MPRQRTTTANFNFRVTPDQDRIVTERADRLGVSVSEALRQLLDLGALMELAERNGVACTDGVQGIVARREPFLVTFAQDPDDRDAGPLWIALPEEVEAEQARQRGES